MNPEILDVLSKLGTFLDDHEPITWFFLVLQLVSNSQINEK